ncbi:helix-turn-helix domain-containing protein [Phytoactinopolyspora mesophila]|uniref:Helix-turn-helix domain-containing protein n=1 Tax=Phytoactinopolyspora mesophila TaxID=2650750 RepID=A0A7K3M2W3_9ACTN|nr:helix-turn-helix domain-containing protein [Phytoactinopolyspora mesophila]NDL57252.1 helix-turn-helix domain-containing protein [Phytoactinopolyspora mesophila]
MDPTTATAMPEPAAATAPGHTTSTKGLLLQHEHGEHLSLRRYPASARTGRFVERYWSVHWDVRDQPVYEVQLIPHPCVNVSFMPGPGCEIYGVVSRSASRQLSGAGVVFGVKFRPGGFTAATGHTASALTDLAIPMRDVFGPAADDLTEAVLATPADTQRLQLVDSFLERVLPRSHDGAYDLTLRMISTMLDDRSITRVSHVAGHHNVSVRTVQRLFHRYVGVGPKWVIRRYRMHDAAELLSSGATDPADLAVRLGWFDQAHFARDFRFLVGMSPGEYASVCAAGIDHVARRTPRKS